MSLRKGDNKKGAQKYQNKTAFKITFDTQAIQVHSRAAMDHLCQRCMEVLKWKMQYNKYKKATSESRCVKCQQKNIYKSYRHACDKCANAFKICAKCLQPNSELSTNPAEEKLKEDKIEKEMEEYLTKLRERTRRTLIRKIQKDLVKWNEDKKCFVEIETGNRLDNLKFKQGLEDDDNVDENDECDEFNANDFTKKEEGQEQAEEQKMEKNEDTNKGTKQPEKDEEIPIEKKPALTQKQMLELAKQIDFSSDDDDDDDDDDDL